MPDDSPVLLRDRSGGRDPVIRVFAAPKFAGDDASRALRAACVSLFSWRCRTPARHAPLPDVVTANPCTTHLAQVLGLFGELNHKM